jgi:hypothetical protein
MEKRTAGHDSPPAQEHAPPKSAQAREEQPTWLRTRPRGNPDVDRADMERSTERLEMLLGH